MSEEVSVSGRGRGVAGGPGPDPETAAVAGSAEDPVGGLSAAAAAPPVLLLVARLPHHQGAQPAPALRAFCETRATGMGDALRVRGESRGWFHRALVHSGWGIMTNSGVRASDTGQGTPSSARTRARYIPPLSQRDRRRDEDEGD